MDKDLESIKAGEGIPKTSANNQSTSGTRVEQRGLTSGKKVLRSIIQGAIITQGRYISKKAKCEYYKDHNSQRIRCGDINGLVLALTCADSGKLKAHRHKYCYTNRWRECPLAKIRGQK